MMKPAAALSGAPEVIVVGEALIDVVLARLDVSTGFLTSIVLEISVPSAAEVRASLVS